VSGMSTSPSNTKDQSHTQHTDTHNDESKHAPYRRTYTARSASGEPGGWIHSQMLG
jgi:hypothetical protein